MAVSYTLSFNPIWYFVDLTGRPLGGGYVVFLDSLNPTQQKLVYQDAGGNFPWPTSTVPNVGTQGVLIDENGTQGEFFFKFDTSNPDSLYNIYLYDLNGVQQGDPIINFTPPGGSGSSVTEVFEINNLINNNVFYFNVGTVTGVPTFQKIAPSNHSGFTATTSNAGPDIIFFKGNTSATDVISFPAFSPGDLFPDVTPTNYFRYVCSVAGASESTKVLQFPINAKIQNLSNEAVTGSFWARSSSSSQVSVQGRQFYGDGAGAHADVISFATAIDLSTTWEKYTFSGSFGNISGNTIGGCGNDATFLQIELPVNATCTIDIVKPELFLGNNPVPLQDFQSYDDIEAKVNSPRTGDIRTSLNSHSFYGWCPMNNGTIGDASSNATTRANIDTFALFNEIWTKMSSLQAFAPMFTSAGAAVAYGATAIADFTAHNQLALTKALGNVFAGTSNSIPSGQTFTADFTTGILTITTATQMSTGTPVVVSNSGGALPTGLNAGQVYYSIFVTATTIKLASTIANAYAGTAVSFSDNGSGTNTVFVFGDTLGNVIGERIAVGSHTHPITNLHVTGGASGTVYNAVAGGNAGERVVGTASGVLTDPWTVSGTSDANSNSQTYNLQPTTWMNVFIKL